MNEIEICLKKELTRIADTLEKLAEQNQKALDSVKQCGTNERKEQEKELKRLMQDPKYWKHQDPETVRRVEEGFKRLYG